ncbi:MAG: radical protein, partial [Bacteroidetes bacterium]|nr:radical protein [Bacteroidota bacterium]
ILEGNSQMNYEDVGSLSFRRNGQVVHNEQRDPTDPNQWPPLPFHKIHAKRYLNRTYLGMKTAAYYSSAGCPFLCGFCAIASIYQARWLARSPELMVNDLMQLKDRYGVDAVEFFDENFFTSEKRAHDFASRMIGKGISWWGEGRPDTVLAYSDETLRLMKQAGCKMIFFGAESSSQETLQKMHKGGTQTPDTVLDLAARLKHVGIVPEFSFVLGSPSDDIEADIDRDIAFIRKVKEINPSSEIILYMYAPVVFEDSELSRLSKEHGFEFPRTLEDWMKPEWQKFDLRKTPVIPWLKPHHYEKIRSFERVLNGYYPTVTDVKLTKFRQSVLRTVSSWRYRSGTYTFPLEIRALLRLFRYRQPELEGF